MNKILAKLFVPGAVLLLTGAVVYLFNKSVAPYLFITGATLVALAQFNMPANKGSLALRRLRRQQLLGACLLVLSGIFMAFTHGNEWIVCLSIAAVLELYTAFRIPQEEEKLNHT